MDQMYRDVERQALGKLAGFLALDKPNDTQIAAARIAAAVFSAVTRRMQTEGAVEATRVLMSRELATDKHEFHRYLQISLPDQSFAKKLPIPKGVPRTAIRGRATKGNDKVRPATRR